MPLKPHRVTAMGFRAVGLSTRTSYDQESDPKTGSIGPLWQRFFAENAAATIPGRVTSLLYGVYSDYTSDHTGAYSLLVGGESEASGTMPAPLASVQVPAAEYLVFSAEGAMPGALIETWMGIWSYFETAVEKRAFTVDFEIHDPTEPDRVDIYIAVDSL